MADLATMVSLLRLYRRLRPRLVHHVTLKPNLYGGIAARVTGVPAVVFSVAGLGRLYVARDLATVLLRHTVNRILSVALGHANGRVIFQNAEDQRQLLEAGAVRLQNSVLIRSSGVDLIRFAPLPEPPGPPVVALCARLIWDKGIDDFVRAARVLRQRGVNARFALVGDTQPSNPRAVPAEMLERWHREGTVEWWGYREDMNAVLGSVHVVCLPSTYGEGVPKVLIEAAACGRPVVATDTPGCRDAVADGVSGLLAPPGQPLALAEVLNRLVADSKLRRVMGANGRSLVEERFDERHVVDRTIQVYSQLTATERWE